MKQAKVPGTTGAVDLRSVKDGAVGPRERDTMQREMEMMAQTRELALRRSVELEQMNEGYSRALSVLVDIYGEDDGEGKKFLAFPATSSSARSSESPCSRWTRAARHSISSTLTATRASGR